MMRGDVSRIMKVSAVLPAPTFIQKKRAETAWPLGSLSRPELAGSGLCDALIG
jgi:hypothetical protein